MNTENISNSDNTEDINTQQNNTGCLKGTIIFAIILFVVLTTIMFIFINNNSEPTNSTNNTNTSYTPQPEITMGYAERYIGVDKKTGDAIDEILKQCGLENITSIQSDANLNDMHFEGEKGYRVETSTLSNITLYLYADYVVYAVRYNSNDLFLNGKIISTIDNYVLSIDDRTTWRFFCEELIKTVLKSPSTAKFPKTTEWSFNKNGNSITVEGYVDSQNSFGAEIRSYFQFVIDSESKSVQSFIFDGEKLI